MVANKLGSSLCIDPQVSRPRDASSWRSAARAWEAPPLEEPDPGPRVHRLAPPQPSRLDTAVAAVLLGLEAVTTLVGNQAAQPAPPAPETFAAKLLTLEARREQLSPEELKAERQALFTQYRKLRTEEPAAPEPGAPAPKGVHPADLPDPAPRAPDAKASLRRFVAPLWTGSGPQIGDIIQGAIGDCFLASSVAATAHLDGGRLRSMVEAKGNGTYSISLYKKDAQGHFKPILIQVDDELYAKSARPLYGSSGAQTKLLWPLIEKAYAQLKGTYGALDGGSPKEALEAIWGRAGVSETVGPLDAHWAAIKASLDAHLPVVVGSSLDPTLQKRTGIVDTHAHTVLRAFEAGGVKDLTLREPYGRYEPVGNGSKDGIFTLAMPTFGEHFDAIFRILP